MQEKKKICKYHGELLSDNIYFDKGYKTTKDGVRKEYKIMRCSICNREKIARYRRESVEANAASRAREREKKLANIDAHNERKRYNNQLDKLKNPEKWKKHYQDLYIERKEKFGGDYSLYKQCQKYKITLDDYYAMVDSQDNKCGLCNKEETCKDPRHDRVRRLSIDHCHKTGKVRALLCNSCNSGIGKFKDDPALLHSALAYLEKYK